MSIQSGRTTHGHFCRLFVRQDYTFITIVWSYLSAMCAFVWKFAWETNRLVSMFSDYAILGWGSNVVVFGFETIDQSTPSDKYCRTNVILLDEQLTVDRSILDPNITKKYYSFIWKQYWAFSWSLLICFGSKSNVDPVVHEI